MTYVYIISEKACSDNNYNTLYTVGFYDQSMKFIPESDHTSSEEAAKRVHYLNGGCEGGCDE